MGDVFRDRGLLDGEGAIRGEAFDGGDFLSGDTGDRGDAGAGCLSVDVDGASAAKSHAAAKFGAGHVQGVTQDPEKRHVWADVDGLRLSVESKGCGHRSS